jgi:hypothetical protein
MLPGHVKSVWNNVFRALNLWSYNSGDALQQTLKELTGVAKKHGRLLWHDWKYLVNLETQGGFHESVPMDDFVGELREWVGGDVTHKLYDQQGVLSEEYFLTTLAEGFEKVLADVPGLVRANEEVLSVAQFALAPGNWARSGSSKTQERLTYTDSRGLRKKVGKNKWNAALIKPAAWVRQVLTTSDVTDLVQHNVAVQKRETGKVRAVVASFDKMYLRMAFVAQYIEACLRGSTQSTLFMSTRQISHMWTEMGQGTNRQSEVKIPLDQSHFDWQQNKRMLRVFIEVMEGFVRRNCPRRDEYLHVLWQIKMGLVELDAYLDVHTSKGLVRILIEKGIMSGWRWTALMDTFFNLAEFHCALVGCSNLGILVNVIRLVAQGDDDDITVATWGQAAAVWAMYRVMNFDINPGKFFVDWARNEFLRLVAQDNIVTGYLVRAVTSLLWRNPISVDPPRGVIRATESAMGWLKAAQRGAEGWEELMYRDISGANGAPEQLVRAWAHTPAAAGGLGLLPHAPSWYTLTPGSVAEEKRVDLDGIRGLQEEFDFYEERGFNVNREKALQEVAENLKTPDARREVIPGKFEEVEAFVPYLWGVERTTPGPPLSASVDRKWPKTIVQHVLNNAIREKEWGHVRDLLSTESQGWFDVIEKRVSRRVFVGWLKGELPWRAPMRPDWGTVPVSVVYDDLARAAWMRVLSRTGVKWSTVKRAALTAELEVSGTLAYASVRVGS